MKFQKIPIEDRFWSKVQKAGQDECWLWQGAQYRSGYGQIRSGPEDGYRFMRAHRVSWELRNGPIPLGLCILHRCDVPKCVNPKHLFLGTHLDNMRDMHAKGRAGKVHVAGIQNGQAKLSEDDVRWVREWSAAGWSQRLLALSVGCKRTNIERIVQGATWRHILSHAAKA